MITLAREKTIEVSFIEDTKVSVTFSIPTAEEAETKFTKDLTDTGLFKLFVTNVKSADITGWTTGITAEEVVTSPGTLGLVKNVAREIMNATFLIESEKN